MKRYVLSLVWLATCLARADTLIVFDPHSVQTSTQAMAPAVAEDPVNRAIFRQCLAEPAVLAYDRSLPLRSPPEWGKTVAADTRGVVAHQATYTHAFRARITLMNLLPNHAYILTLNGRPDLPGNALLPDTVPGLAQEKYVDFLPILTDAQGRFASDVAVRLKPGDYQVRLYVKDRSDFKIVLYHDYFPFVVK